jgi:hypothetical protein
LVLRYSLTFINLPRVPVLAFIFWGHILVSCVLFYIELVLFVVMHSDWTIKWTSLQNGVNLNTQEGNKIPINLYEWSKFLYKW